MLAAVKADVRPVSGELDVERNPPANRQTQGRVRPAQQLVDRRGEPALVPELERVPMWRMPPQRIEKLSQALQVDRPAARELKQDRSQLFTQTARVTQQPLERLLRLLELFHVGQIAAGLDCKEKPVRRVALP